MPNHKPKNKLIRSFEKLSQTISNIVGTPYWFVFSILLVLIWLPSGFFLGWGEIWHLLINTTTTILTFLMMALLHASQSKWEDRMERMQQREGTEIKKIGKHTKTLINETSVKKQPPEDPVEKVDSLY